MERKNKGEYVVGISREEGCIYGIRLIAELLSRGNEVRLVLSQSLEEAVKSGNIELCQWLDSLLNKYHEQLIVCDDEVKDAVSGGRYLYDAVIIVPCGRELFQEMLCESDEDRIAAVAKQCIWEHRPIIIVPERTDITLDYLEEMVKLAGKGVKIIPAIMEMSMRTLSLEEMIDTMVGRILDSLKIENDI